MCVFLDLGFQAFNEGREPGFSQNASVFGTFQGQIAYAVYADTDNFPLVMNPMQDVVERDFLAVGFHKVARDQFAIPSF